jgi:hypothetical protein
MSSAPHRTTSRGGGRAKPTHCPQGHAYSPENSGTRGNGVRYCRICNRTRLAAKRREVEMDEQDQDDGIASGPLAIWVAFVKLCVEDYETLAPTCRDYRTAARFLRGTTLMNADGTIDRHGYSRQPRRTRKRTVKV